MIWRKSRAWRARPREAQALIGACVVALVAVLQLFSAESSRAELAPAFSDGSEYVAIDGDTFARRGDGTRIRVANIDTPETGARTRCAAEQARGELAKFRAGEMLRTAAEVQVEPVGRTDMYGRTVAYVSIDGRDFGLTMIRENLARPWRGRREPWCGADGRLLP